jgi:hypothetical protein
MNQINQSNQWISSTNQPTNEPTNPLTNRPTNRTIDRWTDQPVNPFWLLILFALESQHSRSSTLQYCICSSIQFAFTSVFFFVSFRYVLFVLAYVHSRQFNYRINELSSVHTCLWRIDTLRSQLGVQTLNNVRLNCF